MPGLSRSVVRIVPVVVLLEAAVASSRQGVPKRPEPPVIELPADGRVSVPMGSFGGRPTVEATLGGSTLPFVVDTGASGCAVSDGFADAQKIPVVGVAHFASPDSPEPKEARLLKVASLSVGGIRITGLTAVGMDLSGPFPGPGDPVGVLSAGMFPGYLLTLDYPAKVLTLVRGELPAADEADVFEYAEGRRVPGVTVTLGDQTVELDVDTGSPGGITLPAAWSSKLRLEDEPHESKPDRRVDRVLAAKEARFSGPVRIGRFDLGAQTLRFVEGISRGNVGSDVLRRFSVTLDSKSRRIRLLRPAG
jgi:hypothetical protein